MAIITQAVAEVEDPVAKRLVAQALALYHPGNRPHPCEWVAGPNGRFALGVSSLIKLSAEEYAQRIIDKVADVDEAEGFYSEQGNTLGDRHLSQITTHRENQVRLQIADDWDIVGHLDGVSILPEGLVVHEHKHQDPDDGAAGGNVERATKQAILYAALADKMRAGGATSLLPSDLMGEGATIAPLAPIWGISLHFWPRTANRAKVIARPVEAWELHKVLDIYMRKAGAILASVAAGTIDAARAWVESAEGIQEFKRTLTAQMAGIDNENLLAVCREYEQAKDASNKWDVIKSDRSATACALLAKSGEKSVIVMDKETQAGKATMAGGNGRTNFLKWTPRGVQ